jgi:hypothetical protein
MPGVSESDGFEILPIFTGNGVCPLQVMAPEVLKSSPLISFWLSPRCSRLIRADHFTLKSPFCVNRTLTPKWSSDFGILLFVVGLEVAVPGKPAP